MIRAFPVVPMIKRARVFLLTLMLVAGWAFLISRSSLAQEPADQIAVGERVMLRAHRVNSILSRRSG